MVAQPTPDARIFSALGDPTRLELLARLQHGAALSSTALAAGAPVSRQAVTKHMRVLAEAGLVQDHRRGRERLWRIHAAPLLSATDWLLALIARWAAEQQTAAEAEAGRGPEGGLSPTVAAPRDPLQGRRPEG